MNEPNQPMELIEADPKPRKKRGQVAVVPPPASTLIEAIAQAARDPQVNIEKMERLWAMHEKMQARGAEGAFNSAMNDAQGEMLPVAADADNDQTRSRYATYAKLDAALRPIYTKHGFSISFDTGDSPKETHVRVLAYVSHRAGHTRTYRADMPADGKGAKGGDVMTKTHAAGAAIAYGRRYLLQSIFNVAVGEQDNDGNGMTRDQWLASWLKSITNARSVGELKEIVAMALDEADYENDQDAKDRIHVASAEKLSKAQLKPKRKEATAPAAKEEPAETAKTSGYKPHDPKEFEVPY